MPFPTNWPLFIPAGKVANWLESYAEAMDLDIWLESTVDGSQSRYDESTKSWTMSVLRTVDGKVVERTINVSHVVLATGLIGGKAYMPPPLPGQTEWDGEIKHTSQHAGGKGLDGKRVLVIGSSTSGHDVSVDLVKHHAEVTMLQRSPTFVMSFKAGLPVLCEYSLSYTGKPQLTCSRRRVVLASDGRALPRRSRGPDCRWLSAPRDARSR